MSKVTIATVCALAVTGTFFTGCLSTRLSDAQTTRSFEDPPVRETVTPYPKETLVGKWRAKGCENTFMQGKRAIVTDIVEDLELKQDGTCTATTTKTISEDHIGAGFGPGRGKDFQLVYEGTWKYSGDILTLDLSTDVKVGFISKTLKIAQEHTVKWHSDEEFSLRDTDEQFAANAAALGRRIDDRKLEPNGVETFRRKATASPVQTVFLYTAPYKRIEDTEE